MKTKKNKDRNALWMSGIDNAAKFIMLLCFLIGAVIIALKQDAWNAAAENAVMLSPMVKSMMSNLLLVYLVAGGIIVVALMCCADKRRVRAQFESIGLTNHAGMTPVLLRKYQERNHSQIIIWEFRNYSIPLEEWEKKRAAIETALSINIIKIEYSAAKRHIRIYAVPASRELQPVIPWSDCYLSNENFVLTLGESHLGLMTVNLNHIPHILIGGSTGSGKSILLKSLLMQAYRKGAVIYVADFKGGVDYPKIWHEKCRMCTDERALLYYLTQLTTVLESRKKQFAESGCPNLDAYNQITGENMPRLIFACDEVAELLDKTGADSERKKLIAQVENKLATIARQGRAFGVHLILATQRPDANIIPGQIKNNMDFRVCGRADNVLSQIILDSTIAADQIPKDTQGRFITSDGTVFQGYFFDESKL